MRTSNDLLPCKNMTGRSNCNSSLVISTCLTVCLLPPRIRLTTFLHSPKMNQINAGLQVRRDNLRMTGNISLLKYMLWPLIRVVLLVPNSG